MRLRASFAAVAVLLGGAVACGRSDGHPRAVPTRAPAAAYAGFTLFAPNFTTTTFLVDMDGRVVHRWRSDHEPGQSAYLLPNGNLLRTGNVGPGNRTFHGGGAGGRVQEYTWEGSLVWDFTYSSDEHLLHHDVRRLPNGNTLMIAWERKTADQCRAAGRAEVLSAKGDLWSDFVIEVRPVGMTGGEIVWEWHAFDHLVQEDDAKSPKYGRLAEHPGRIDANHQRWAEQTPDAEWERLRGLGYVGAAGPRLDPDWLHTNSVDYDPIHDRILLSVLGFNEVWIIDHGTTTEEAAGPAGDLLWRWGNPKACGLGTSADRRLFAQHDASFIPAGCPGAGNVLVFNNGRGRPGGDASSVEEIVLPLDGDGRFVRDSGKPFGPDAPVWTFAAEGFYSDHISGAQRLPNGNTLVCSGDQGWIFEVTPDGALVWEHKYVSAEPRPERRPPPPGSGGPKGGPPGRPPENPSCIFRAYRYGVDFPAFIGKELSTTE